MCNFFLLSHPCQISAENFRNNMPEFSFLPFSFIFPLFYMCTRFANSETLSRVANEGTFILGKNKSGWALHLLRNLLGC